MEITFLKPMYVRILFTALPGNGNF